MAHCDILLPFSHSYANLLHEADLATWHQRPTILAWHLDWCSRSDFWCAPLHPGVSKCLRGLLPWWCDGGPKNNINTVQLLMLQNSQYWIAPLLHLFIHYTATYNYFIHFNLLLVFYRSYTAPNTLCYLILYSSFYIASERHLHLLYDLLPIKDIPSKIW